jgi:AcrR family transcriptional regulator
MQNISLVQNCLTLFLSRGLRVSMDDIAHELGISKRTLYELFENKTELIYKCLLLLFEKEKKTIDYFLSKDNSSALEELFPILNINIYNAFKDHIPFFMEIKRHYPELFDNLVATHFEGWQTRIGTILENGIKQGVFREGINIDIIKIFLFDLQMTMKDKKELYKQYSFHEVFENTIFCFVRGFSTLKGWELIENVCKNKQTPHLDDTIC